MNTELLQRELLTLTEQNRVLRIENDKLNAENDNLRQKLHPFAKVEDALSRCRQEIVAGMNFGESVRLSKMISDLGAVGFTEILHAIRCLEDRREVDCSHDLAEENGLLDRITITRRA